MALHLITDSFAHRPWVRKVPLVDDWWNWQKIGDAGENTDEVSAYSSRYKAAGIVVKNAINQCLSFNAKGELIMKNCYTIRSRQIMDGNIYFDNSFLLKDLYKYAKMNENNDNTFIKYKKRLAECTYSDDNNTREEINKILLDNPSDIWRGGR